MPIYEYRCEDCGNIGEFLVGIGQGEEEIKCRCCGSHQLARQLSTSNISRHGPIEETTCCGRQERCDSPPCSATSNCRR